MVRKMVGDGGHHHSVNAARGVAAPSCRRRSRGLSGRVVRRSPATAPLRDAVGLALRRPRLAVLAAARAVVGGHLATVAGDTALVVVDVNARATEGAGRIGEVDIGHGVILSPLRMERPQSWAPVAWAGVGPAQVPL